MHSQGLAHDHMCSMICCRRRNALFTRDRVLGHGSSAVEDLKYMKHEQSDADLEARTLRLDSQPTALLS